MSTAYIFPGQGSQFPGMGKELYDADADVRELYNRASKIAGFDIAEISFESDKAILAKTNYTQPCIYVHSFAALLSMGNKTHYDAVAGHSLGEYTALAAAKVFSFEDGLAAVVERGKLMAAAKEGTMYAPIGAKLEDVQNVVDELKRDGIIEVANYNAPGQFIISGQKTMLDTAGELLKERGARKIIPLPVGGAFHSPLMNNAGCEIGKVLDKIEFRIPHSTFYANVTGNRIDDPREIKKNLVLQLTHPVRWIDIIKNLIKDGNDSFVEVGPGKVLRGLVKRIDKTVKAIGWEEI